MHPPRWGMIFYGEEPTTNSSQKGEKTKQTKQQSKNTQPARRKEHTSTNKRDEESGAEREQEEAPSDNGRMGCIDKAQEVLPRLPSRPTCARHLLARLFYFSDPSLGLDLKLAVCSTGNNSSPLDLDVKLVEATHPRRGGCLRLPQCRACLCRRALCVLPANGEPGTATSRFLFCFSLFFLLRRTRSLSTTDIIYCRVELT